jgi:hypothetical protein
MTKISIMTKQPSPSSRLIAAMHHAALTALTALTALAASPNGQLRKDQILPTSPTKKSFSSTVLAWPG